MPSSASSSMGSPRYPQHSSFNPASPRYTTAGYPARSVNARARNFFVPLQGGGSKITKERRPSSSSSSSSSSTNKSSPRVRKKRKTNGKLSIQVPNKGGMLISSASHKHWILEEDASLSGDIAVPEIKVQTLTTNRIRNLTQQESSSEEDTGDSDFEERHRQYEEEERRLRRKERKSVTWAVCDRCRKWRIVKGRVKLRQNWFCGDSSTDHDHTECEKPDDWIVMCVGVPCAKQLSKMGISTVEVLSPLSNGKRTKKMEALVQKLTEAGFLYQQQDQKIINISSSAG